MKIPMLAPEIFHRIFHRSARSLHVAVLLLTLGFVVTLRSQEAPHKVIARTAPSYPELAKRMHLAGKVKLEVVITAGGSVTSVKLIGGNPVFEKSAVEAVRQWKFEPGQKETSAVIVLEFTDPSG